MTFIIKEIGWSNINIKRYIKEKRKVYQEGRRWMEKQIVNIFLLLGFNYYMIKSWGTRKVTLLTVIGNYFLISILIESYFGLPKFIEIFNAIFMFGISLVGTYNLWQRRKAWILTDYEKRGWRLIRILDVLIIISVLVLVLFFLFIKYF